MIRRPPRSTRTDTLFPYTTLFRSVRENCLNCHTPHGSNQHALLVAPVPMLCQQCHSHTRHPNDMFNEQMLGNAMSPDERLMGRGCLTCHSQIHGSNNPRTEERRVGKECVSTWRSRRTRNH